MSVNPSTTNDMERQLASPSERLTAMNGSGALHTCQVTPISNSTPVKKKMSKYKGVTWDDEHQKWLAKINIDYKLHRLGYYSVEKNAALVFDQIAGRLNRPVNFRSSAACGDRRFCYASSYIGVKRVPNQDNTGLQWGAFYSSVPGGILRKLGVYDAEIAAWGRVRQLMVQVQADSAVNASEVSDSPTIAPTLPSQDTPLYQMNGQHVEKIDLTLQKDKDVEIEFIAVHNSQCPRKKSSPHSATAQNSTPTFTQASTSSPTSSPNFTSTPTTAATTTATVVTVTFPERDTSAKKDASCETIVDVDDVEKSETLEKDTSPMSDAFTAHHEKMLGRMNNLTDRFEQAMREEQQKASAGLCEQSWGEEIEQLKSEKDSITLQFSQYKEWATEEMDSRDLQVQNMHQVLKKKESAIEHLKQEMKKNNSILEYFKEKNVNHEKDCIKNQSIQKKTLEDHERVVETNNEMIKVLKNQGQALHALLFKKTASLNYMELKHEIETVALKKEIEELTRSNMQEEELQLACAQNDDWKKKETERVVEIEDKSSAKDVVIDDLKHELERITQYNQTIDKKCNVLLSLVAQKNNQMEALKKSYLKSNKSSESLMRLGSKTLYTSREKESKSAENAGGDEKQQSIDESAKMPCSNKRRIIDVLLTESSRRSKHSSGATLEPNYDRDHDSNKARIIVNNEDTSSDADY